MAAAAEEDKKRERALPPPLSQDFLFLIITGNGELVVKGIKIPENDILQPQPSESILKADIERCKSVMQSRLDPAVGKIAKGRKEKLDIAAAI